MAIFLAIDIGASSGRHMIGLSSLEGMEMIEVYRFSNHMTKQGNDYIWDMDRLFDEVCKGIQVALQHYPTIESLSIDTWGCDYVLMKDDQVIGPCYAYRSDRTQSVITKVHSLISFDCLYQLTGTQFQPFNTLYQLYADLEKGRLTEATDFLMIPEYLIYRLTGHKVKELTNASTTGLCDPDHKCFVPTIIEKLQMPSSLFPTLSLPHTLVGSFTPEMQLKLGGTIQVILGATHDTASAVEGIPLQSNCAYISSGTWSLLGVRLPQAIKTFHSQQANFANELGPSYIRYQKNIMGLWIVQRLQEELQLSFEAMIELARGSSYTELFDVNDVRFLNPPSMEGMIHSFFKQHGERQPQTTADLLNATYHSLAYSYALAMNEVCLIIGHPIHHVVIVGGGAKNTYLNELTQRYVGVQVTAVPHEITAAGNLKIQKEFYDERSNLSEV